MYLLLQHCGVSMISISYAVTSSAGKGYVACVENFHLSCCPDQAGFWLSQRTFAAGPTLSFPLPQKICGLGGSWTGSDGLFPQTHNISNAATSSLCRSFEFCCQLYFLWIKCCCYRIPGSPEYKRINYVSTQQHLSLKFGIIYLASA